MSDDILEIIDIWVQFMKVCAFLPLLYIPR